MKTKNLVLGIAAVLFAVGGAIASSLLTVPTFVYGKSSTNPSAHCISVGSVCNADGTTVCKIQIPVNGVNTIPTQVFNSSSCSTLLTDIRTQTTSATPVETITELVTR